MAFFSSPESVRESQRSGRNVSASAPQTLGSRWTAITTVNLGMMWCVTLHTLRVPKCECRVGRKFNAVNFDVLGRVAEGAEPWAVVPQRLLDD